MIKVKKEGVLIMAGLIFTAMALMPAVKCLAVEKEGEGKIILAQAVDVWGTVDNPDLAEDYVGTATGLSANKDPRQIIADIIQIVLGFLGILAVIIILVGGFKWMTAGGNDDQVDEAKKWIISGVIGLVIILASYALANFVLNQLMTATTG